MLLSIYRLLQIISCIPCVVHYILELILYPIVCTVTSLLPYCPSPLVTTVCSMSLLSFLKNYLFLAVLGLHCAARGLSLVAESGAYSLVVVHGFLIAVASLIVEPGL